VEDHYIEYVTSKEDIHELSYRQAEKGGLSRSTFIILGSIFRFGFLILFMYFTYLNYIAMRYNEEFLSLSVNAGDCRTVPKLYVFPSLAADYDGHWQGEEEYETAKAAYRFELFDFSATQEEYVAFMASMKNALISMGEKGKGHNLAINLLFWCFWSHDIPHMGEVQKLSMAGSPAYIFDLDQIQGTISNIDYDCEAHQSKKFYDVSRGQLTMVFSASALASNKNCSGILNPVALGYHESVTEDVFTMTLDVESVLTALSVKYDVLHVRDLIDVYTLLETLVYNKVEYRVEVKYHMGNYAV
jgi:hypothetical protein